MGDVRNIYQRMVEVQKKVRSIVKNEVVKMYENDKGYKAVTHDDVAAALHLPLAECGIVLLPNVESFETTSFDKTNQYGKMVTWYRTDIKISVKWINADKPEDFFESSGGAFALDTSDKSFAKAYSLALKIILLKVHLLESKDEEEARPFDAENGGENGNSQGQQKKQANKQQPTQNKIADKAHDKPKTGSTTDPGHYVMPFGQNVKGKALKNLTEVELKGIYAVSKAELGKTPDNAQWIEIEKNVREFLASMDVKV